MFYSNLKKLCIRQNLKLTNVLKDLNISIGNTTKWKNGTLPNGAILIKFADYFNCSVDFLLGRTDDPKMQNAKSFETFGEIIQFIDALARTDGIKVKFENNAIKFLDDESFQNNLKLCNYLEKYQNWMDIIELLNNDNQEKYTVPISTHIKEIEEDIKKLGADDELIHS